MNPLGGMLAALGRGSQIVWVKSTGRALGAQRPQPAFKALHRLAHCSLITGVHQLQRMHAAWQWASKVQGPINVGRVEFDPGRLHQTRLHGELVTVHVGNAAPINPPGICAIRLGQPPTGPAVLHPRRPLPNTPRLSMTETNQPETEDRLFRSLRS